MLKKVAIKKQRVWLKNKSLKKNILVEGEAVYYEKKSWMERDDLYLREWPDLKEKESDERAWLKERRFV